MIITKRIGLFIGFIGMITTISNISRLMLLKLSYGEILRHKSVNFVVLFALFFIIMSLSNNKTAQKINGFMQFLIFFIFATIATFDQFHSWYGIGFFALAIMLGSKYNYFVKYKRIKIISIALYIGIVVEIATRMKIESGYGAEVLIYLGFFFGMMFLTYYDELNITRKNVGKLKYEKEQLENRILKETQQVRMLSEQIELYENREKAIDLKERKVTKAERSVLECLVRYSESNSDIARRLNKSEETVKVQMRSLFDKIGAENRYQLIDLCRNNFKDNVSDKLR